MTLKRLSSSINRLFGRLLNPARPTVKTYVFDDYASGMPSHQNAVDLVPGWNHAFPPETGVAAGKDVMYGDDRIHWGLQQFGSLSGKAVLELGPLEAAHTYILNNAQPQRLLAIEANKLAFMRCLIAKEVMNLDRAHFLLGDCQVWLDQTTDRFDLIVASGILYHMSRPVDLIVNMARHSDALLIWTHYFDELDMPPGDLRRTPFLEKTQLVNVLGTDIRLHMRAYFHAEKDQKFCGGMEDVHYWLEKGQILELLDKLGFDDVRLAHEQPNHQNGPALLLFARRSESSA